MCQVDGCSTHRGPLSSKPDYTKPSLWVHHHAASYGGVFYFHVQLQNLACSGHTRLTSRYQGINTIFMSTTSERSAVYLIVSAV